MSNRIPQILSEGFNRLTQVLQENRRLSQQNEQFKQTLNIQKQKLELDKKDFQFKQERRAAGMDLGDNPALKVIRFNRIQEEMLEDFERAWTRDVPDIEDPMFRGFTTKDLLDFIHDKRREISRIEEKKLTGQFLDDEQVARIDARSAQLAGELDQADQLRRRLLEASRQPEFQEQISAVRNTIFGGRAPGQAGAQQFAPEEVGPPSPGEQAALPAGAQPRRTAGNEAALQQGGNRMAELLRSQASILSAPAGEDVGDAVETTAQVIVQIREQLGQEMASQMVQTNLIDPLLANGEVGEQRAAAIINRALALVRGE